MGITYEVATNVIRVTGYMAQTPCTFNDLWNADKAGTLSLHSRTGIVAADPSPVNLTTNLKPTDLVLLGGAKQNLYFVVANWTNMTSATIRLIGTDENSAALTEDVSVNGNGTYYASKLFKTLTQSQVTAFSGTGSFAYEVKQAQWGVVWKLGTAQFQFDCVISIGNDVTASYFADNAKLVVFTVSTTWQMRVYANASCILGVLSDATTKSTKQGCTTVSTASTGFFRGIGGSAKLYSHKHIGTGTSHWALQSNAGGYITAVYNCMFENVKAVTSYGTAFDLFNVYVAGSETTCADGTITPIVDGLTCKASNYAVTFQGANSLTLRNLIGGKQATAFILAWATSVNHYLINATWLDSANWTISWGGGTSTGKIYRQYSFDVKVTDAANNPLDAARVVLKDKNGTEVFNVVTDVNGVITQQIVSRGYYDQTHGNTFQDLGPHVLTISKDGYQTYKKTLVLGAAAIWEMKLTKSNSVFFSSGKPLVNVKPTDPENNNLLVI